MIHASRRLGITIIEATVVLGIAGMLTAGVWAAAATAMDNYKKAEAAKQATLVIQNTRGVYQQRTSFTGLNNAYAIKAGIFPVGMADATTNLVQNIYSGSVNLNVNASDASIANLAFSGLPSYACTSFVLALAGGNATSSSGAVKSKLNRGYEIVSVSKGSNSPSGQTGNFSILLPVINPATAATACSASSDQSGGNATLTVNFRLYLN